MGNKKLDGQLWEECPICGNEPVYLSLGSLCKDCGTNDTIENSSLNEIYGDEE